MKRLDFIKTISLISGGLIIPNKTFPNVFLSNDSGLKTIRDNTGIFVKRGGTIGWYADKDGAAVVDAQYPETAQIFLEDFKNKTGRKIDILFNTHHHDDHTAGNTYLRDYVVKIVAHENCPRLQKEKVKADKKVYADTTFKNEWRVSFGKETVSARHFMPAHTGGDAVIHFENANVVHVGDLVFNRLFPYIDLPAGGSISGWIDVLETMHNLYNDDSVFIFGHAADEEKLTGGRSDLLFMRDYFTALMNFVKKEKASGKTGEEIIELKEIPGFTALKQQWKNALKANLYSAYVEQFGNE